MCLLRLINKTWSVLRSYALSTRVLGTSGVYLLAAGLFILCFMAKDPNIKKYYKTKNSEVLNHFEFYFIFYTNYQFALRTINFETGVKIYNISTLGPGFTQTLKSSWHLITTPVEVFCSASSEQKTVYETFLINWNGASTTFVSSGKKLWSRTAVYPGRSWPERELREQAHLPISGLKDSRRLLSDYGTLHHPVDISYNHLIQDII